MTSPETDAHIGRLVVLVDAFSSTSQSLDGLTKLAKLDFLVRYPVFLQTLAQRRRLKVTPSVAPTTAEEAAVEDPMIRYKYGPWDNRYYTLIGELVGRELATYVPGQGRVALRSTARGRSVAEAIRTIPEWQRTVDRIDFVRRNFDYSGNRLKELIYDAFPGLVAQDLRSSIQSSPEDVE